MKIRRLLSVFLLAALLCGLFTVPAAALEDPDIRAKAALLVEAETGTILYDKNAHDELSIASTTKIMSALLIFEAIERGELRMDQSVTATASARQKQSRIILGCVMIPTAATASVPRSPTMTRLIAATSMANIPSMAAGHASRAKPRYISLVGGISPSNSSSRASACPPKKRFPSRITQMVPPKVSLC